jgi:hypothetical protein
MSAERRCTSITSITPKPVSAMHAGTTPGDLGVGYPFVDILE